MKTLQRILLVGTAFFTLGWMSVSCEGFVDPVSATSDAGQVSDLKVLVDSLNDQELYDLLHLAEEEKLARDVYIYAYNVYGYSIFNNISKSEQTHMDAVLSALTQNGIDAPTHEEFGVFHNDALQALYDELVAKVDLSLLDALEVGATIEDLDIMDIDEFINNTSRLQLMTMYNKLKCGSRNHMRSYYAQIVAQGGDYTPQFVSEALFFEIVQGDRERCWAE